MSALIVSYSHFPCAPPPPLEVMATTSFCAFMTSVRLLSELLFEDRYPNALNFMIAPKIILYVSKTLIHLIEEPDQP